MGLLKDEQRDQLKELFQGLTKTVKIVFFTSKNKCETCDITKEMLEEIITLSEKIELETYDLEKDPEKVDEFGIERVPAMTIMADKDLGIKFYGVPAGHEFTSVIEDILMVGTDQTGLPEDITAELAKVKNPVHIEVMVTPTCPLCPQMVGLAHRFAAVSENIKSDMIETSEYPEIVEKHNVSGVPHTVLNGEITLVGQIPPKEFTYAVLMAAGEDVPQEFVKVIESMGSPHSHEHAHAQHGHEHVHDHPHEHADDYEHEE
jgi:glutaredoxin-like protein